MGREIRRVPPNWEHPRHECRHSPWAGGCDEAKRHDGMCLRPLYDKSFIEAAAAWKAEYAKWERGERPADYSADDAEQEFWEWRGDPPNRENYRPYWAASDATHYQVYETVSEGTPVTPSFATKAALLEHLVKHGDSWDQSRGNSGWRRESAERFVNSGWAPSLVAIGGVVKSPREQ